MTVPLCGTDCDAENGAPAGLSQLSASIDDCQFSMFLYFSRYTQAQFLKVLSSFHHGSHDRKTLSAGKKIYKKNHIEDIQFKFWHVKIPK